MLLSLVVLAGCSANARFDLSGAKSEQSQTSTASPPQLPAGDESHRKASLGWAARRQQPDATFEHEVVVVRQGDTIYDIAHRHNVTVPMIFTANGLVSDRIVPGQHLLVPVRPGGSEADKAGP